MTCGIRSSIAGCFLLLPLLSRPHTLFPDAEVPPLTKQFAHVPSVPSATRTSLKGTRLAAQDCCQGENRGKQGLKENLAGEEEAQVGGQAGAGYSGGLDPKQEGFLLMMQILPVISQASTGQHPAALRCPGVGLAASLTWQHYAFCVWGTGCSPGQCDLACSLGAMVPTSSSSHLIQCSLSEPQDSLWKRTLTVDQAYCVLQSRITTIRAFQELDLSEELGV